MSNATTPCPSGASKSRRAFVKASALALGAAALPRFSIAQSGPSANGQLNVACIGVGGRGNSVLKDCLRNAKVVALCDVDAGARDGAVAAAAELGHSYVKDVPFFQDYREMLDQMGGSIDAVTVATPDHSHYPASLMAIERGKHLFCEKPLTHTVGEARALRDAARRRKVVTQMGNQGHATEGIRLCKEWYEAGLLGEVDTVVGWAPAHPDNYFRHAPEYPLPEEAKPAGLDWNLWLGPAEERPYNSIYTPRFWRGFWDFGNGTLGDWACHTLDAPFWSLALGAPKRVSAVTARRNSYQPAAWSKVTWEFPARNGKPPVKLHWHTGNGTGEIAHIPDWPFGREPQSRGMAMLGSDNTLLTGGRPDSPQLLSEKAMERLKRNLPAKTHERVKGGPVTEWVRAIIGEGPTPGSSFEYASPFTEMVLLGCLAIRTGETIEWDADEGKVTNKPYLNDYINKRYRKGWDV